MAPLDTPPPDTPLDEYDRVRIEHRDAAQRWIGMLNRGWLVGQLATLALLGISFLLLGPQGWWAFPLMEAAWGLSILAASGSAGLTLWNWSALPTPWRVIGLAPFAIGLAEVMPVALRFA